MKLLLTSILLLLNISVYSQCFVVHAWAPKKSYNPLIECNYYQDPNNFGKPLTVFMIEDKDANYWEKFIVFHYEDEKGCCFAPTQLEDYVFVGIGEPYLLAAPVCASYDQKLGLTSTTRTYFKNKMCDIDVCYHENGWLYRSSMHMEYEEFKIQGDNFSGRSSLCIGDFAILKFNAKLPISGVLEYSVNNSNFSYLKNIPVNSSQISISWNDIKDLNIQDNSFKVRIKYKVDGIDFFTNYWGVLPFYPSISINTDNLIVNNDTLSLPLTVNQTASIRDYFSENTPETISNNHKLLGGHSYEVYIKEDNKCPITKYVYLPEIQYNTIDESNNHFWYEDEVSNALNIIYNYPEILKDKTNPYSHSSDNGATFSNASRSLLGKITIKSPYNSSERIDTIGIKETFSVVTNKNLTKITIEPKSSEFSDFIPINITDIKLSAYSKIEEATPPSITYPDKFCYDSQATLNLGSYNGGLGNKYYYQINSGTITEISDKKQITIDKDTPEFSLTIWDTDDPNVLGREMRKKVYSNFYKKDWPNEVKINTTNYENVKCYNNSNGKIEIINYQLSRAGLTPKFTLKKENVTIVEDYNNTIFENLKSGSYWLYLSDNKGCKAIEIPIEITQPEELKIDNKEIQNATCFNYSDGSVQLAITGGTEPYKLFWNEKDTNIQKDENNKYLFDKLKAGIYKFKILDKNNCETSDSYTITQPDELKNSIPSKFELCDNEEYTIDVGEDEHFTNYEWVFPNNEKVEGRIFTINSQSLGGKYKLISKNANCFTENETDISFLHTKINNHKFTDLKCFEDKSGKIEIIDFQMCKENLTPLFILTNLDSKDVLNQSNILFSNLKAGNYSLKLKDDYCYSDEVSIKISQPPLFQLNSDIKNVTCFDYSDGFVKAKVSGGTKPYFIEWINGNEINKFNDKNEELYIFDNLKKGSYNLKVVDKNGCEKSDLYIITQPEKLENSIQSNFEICKNGELVIDQGANNNFDRYEWTFPNGEKFNERILNVNSQFSEGDYILTSYKGECFTKNITNIKFSENEIPIRFLVASENYLNDTLVVTEDTENSYLFDYFYEYDTENLKKIDINGEKNQFYLQAKNPGIYKITIHATDQNCITSKSKEITIINDQRDYFADNEYFTVGIFTNLKLGPSPNNGEFTLYVNLEKEAELEYSLTDLSRGVNVPLNINKPNYKSANYEIQFSGLNLKRGLYILMVKAENQTKKIKFVVEK